MLSFNIIMNQRLGFRALVVYIIKGVLPGVVLLFLTFIVLSAKNTLINIFIGSGYTGSDSINKIILFLIGGFYILSFLILVLGVTINLLHYIGCRFGMDDYGFKLHRGIISRDEVSIPYRQIQDVNVDQSIFGRIIGVGKLIILTAANNEKEKHGEESEVVLGTIDISIAKSLQKQLIEKSSIQLVKEAK